MSEQEKTNAERRDDLVGSLYYCYLCGEVGGGLKNPWWSFLHDLKVYTLNYSYPELRGILTTMGNRAENLKGILSMWSRGHNPNMIVHWWHEDFQDKLELFAAMHKVLKERYGLEYFGLC